jgi:hypothetical protein
VRGDDGVEAVASFLGAAVRGEVLGRGVGAAVEGVVALDALNEGCAQRGGEKGIFAVGLLAASPAWVAEDVDVGGPEGEAGVTRRIAIAMRIEFGASLGGDGFTDCVEQRGVPRGSEADGLGEDGGVAVRRRSSSQ